MNLNNIINYLEYHDLLNLRVAHLALPILHELLRVGKTQTITWTNQFFT